MDDLRELLTPHVLTPVAFSQDSTSVATVIATELDATSVTFWDDQVNSGHQDISKQSKSAVPAEEYLADRKPDSTVRTASCEICQADR